MPVKVKGTTFGFITCVTCLLMLPIIPVYLSISGWGGILEEEINEEELVLNNKVREKSTYDCDSINGYSSDIRSNSPYKDPVTSSQASDKQKSTSTRQPTTLKTMVSTTTGNHF